MDDGEDTFASDPGTVLVLDPAVVQRGRLVVSDTSSMDLLGERDLFRMKVLPAGSTPDFLGGVS